MEIDLEQSDEEYVVQRAKEALKIDPYSAKAWMLTAKSLYPNNFGVQFEAYLIEKTAGNIKEAAKYFSDLIGKFQQATELWKEIEKVTMALRSETDTDDPEKQFLCEMFKHISSDVQHKLLLFTADHCEDTMEHCRLLLLLLQRFPTAISSYGPRLVDTLMSAEKHSVDGHFPINSYRKLLVCELLPLLAKQEIKLDLSSKLLLKLLNKALEYYLCCLGRSSTISQDTESSMENTWTKLFSVLEFIGKQLNWEPALINFTINWSKESYWQKILSYCQMNPKNIQYDDKQMLFCLSIFFLYCLHEYNASLIPEQPPGQTATPYLLVEAFTDPTLPNPISEPKSKKRKSDTDLIHTSNPHISVEKTELKVMQSNFLMCVNCWDLLYSSESLHREFLKIHSHLKLDLWLSLFIIDYALYRARYDDALICLQKVTDNNLFLQKYIRLASILYIKKTYSENRTDSSDDDATCEMEDSFQETQSENQNMTTDEDSPNTANYSVTQNNIPESMQVASNADIKKPASSKASASLTLQRPANPTTSKVILKDNALNKIDAQKNVTDSSTTKMLKKKKSTEDDNQRQEAYLIMEIMYDNKMERDEYQIFGDLVAAKLRKLTTNHAKDAVQHLISNILWEASLGKYDYPPRAYPNSRPQSSSSQFYSSEGTTMPSPSFHSNESQFLEIAPRVDSAGGLQSGNRPDPTLSESSDPDLISQVLLDLCPLS